jgi:hypothetical protein
MNDNLARYLEKIQLEELADGMERLMPPIKTATCKDCGAFVGGFRRRCWVCHRAHELVLNQRERARKKVQRSSC